MPSYLVEQPDKRFFLHEGGELASLEDLFTELQSMKPHVFQHHVNADKNDFAVWVRDVMQDRFLAKNMVFAKTKDDLMKLLFIQLFR